MQYTATDLRFKAREVFDLATKVPVRITRNGVDFTLLKADSQPGYALLAHKLDKHDLRLQSLEAFKNVVEGRGTDI